MLEEIHLFYCCFSLILANTLSTSLIHAHYFVLCISLLDRCGVYFLFWHFLEVLVSHGYQYDVTGYAPILSPSRTSSNVSMSPPRASFRVRIWHPRWHLHVLAMCVHSFGFLILFTFVAWSLAHNVVNLTIFILTFLRVLSCSGNNVIIILWRHRSKCILTLAVWNFT